MKQLRTAICLVVLCLLAFTLVSCGSSTTTTETTDTTPPQAPQPSPQPPSKWNDPTGANVISANVAADYYGQNKIVQGLIVNTLNSGNACFLDFRLDYQNGFVGVIFAADYPAFSPSPQNFYMNKEVRITGQVTKYQGHPQIIIKSPNQIEISKDTASVAAPATSPPPTYSNDDYDEQTLEDAGIHQDENGDYVDEDGNLVDPQDYIQQ